MSVDILVFDGDGIGPEIMCSTIAIIELLNAKLKLNINLKKEILGFELLKQKGVTFTDDLLLKSKEADGIILGPVDHNDYPSVSRGGINPSAKFRIELDLYSNIRPAKNYINVKSLSQNMDLVIVRENTEGFYADRNMYDGNGEFSPVPGIGLSLRKITKEASLKIAESAFEIALSRSVNKNISKVHVIHKANVMKITDGMKVIVCRLKSNNMGYTSIAYPTDEMQLPDWFKELPFDDASMETAVVDKKVENLLGVLKWDLSATDTTNTFHSLFEFDD